MKLETNQLIRLHNCVFVSFCVALVISHSLTAFPVSITTGGSDYEKSSNHPTTLTHRISS